MLNLPQNTLVKVKELLTRQQSQVEKELEDIDKVDPVMSDALAESSEPGSESFEADAHNRLTALKKDLMNLLRKTKNSLASINKGTYGICEKCKKPIEQARLKAMPAVTVCVSCSKKTRR